MHSFGVVLSQFDPFGPTWTHFHYSYFSYFSYITYFFLLPLIFPLFQIFLLFLFLQLFLLYLPYLIYILRLIYLLYLFSYVSYLFHFTYFSYFYIVPTFLIFPVSSAKGLSKDISHPLIQASRAPHRAPTIGVLGGKGLEGRATTHTLQQTVGPMKIVQLQLFGSNPQLTTQSHSKRDETNSPGT